MAASPAIDLGEPLAALFKRARVADSLYRRYEGRLAELGVGDAGDLLEEVAEKGIGSLDIHDRQAEKLRRALLGRRGWGDAAAVLASLSGLSLGDTPAGVAAGDQAAGGGAAAGGEGRGGARPQEADGGACDAQAAEGEVGGGTEVSSLDPLVPALPTSGDGTIAAAGGEEEVEGGRKAPRRRRGRRGRGARGRGGGLEKGPDTAAGLAAERPNQVEEVSTGGAAPAEGEEGGPPSLAADGPGRAPYWGPAGITPPETPVSDAAGAPHPFNLLDEATGSKAGEAAAEALAEAAVDAVYGALVAATLEEWAGASTDNPVSAEDARGPGLECQDCFENFYEEYDVEPWLWRRALREGWSELGGWSREEMEAAEKEIWRGESSEISQLGEWVCDACLEGYLGGGVGDYSELRSGYVAPYPSNPWIGRSRDLSWMRKGPIGVTRREALLAAEEAKAAARAAEKAARAAEGGKGGGSGRQSREARRRKGSSSRGGVRTARREDEEPEPGEGWEGGARPEEYDGLFDGP